MVRIIAPITAIETIAEGPSIRELHLLRQHDGPGRWRKKDTLARRFRTNFFGKFLFSMFSLLNAMAKVFYVYLLHESPIVEPFYCKIGYSCDPLRRLDQLQAGNPRSLRSWDDERRPTEPFGLRISTREHARALEQLIIDQLEGMGMRLRRDYDYKNNCAAAREWFEGMHPKDLWIEMVKIYFYYLALNKDAEIA